MPGKVAKIGTFSDWVGLFDEWRKEIGVNRDEIAEFKFDTLYGAIETEEIQFGHFKSRRKWENLRQIPTQQMRDALLNMIVYQGDTEFASVEQQRHLFETAPTDWDRRAITRVMIEEMRHAWLIQKYLNKWISCSYDLFGTDHSSSAHWAYVWGIKGRYDEPKNDRQADLDDLNDYNRHLYRDEVAGLIDRFNSVLKPGEPKLYAPNIKFNRAIGRWAGQKFHAQTGEPLNDKAYEQHLSKYMPSAEDKKLLLDIIANEKKWIAEKEGARDPFETIAEPRKSAINL